MDVFIVAQVAVRARAVVIVQEIAAVYAMVHVVAVVEDLPICTSARLKIL